MNDAVKIPDLAERARALDPRVSFIVQAPAGSGKTELLIQRVLALLATVERPEEIAAITFTVKAAAEMRLRVFDALHAARHDPEPDPGHAARTWGLARAALARNDALGWKLEETVERLRVQTIDALCASLTRQMPVLSRFGGQPESVEDASAMYTEAARALLAQLEGADESAAADVARLLGHVDNDAAKAESLVATMLASRDHWMRKLLRGAMDRERLEEALREVRGDAVARVQRAWPPGLPAPDVEDIQAWIDHGKRMLNSEGKKWLKSSPESLKDAPGMLELLRDLAILPPATFDDAQWDALETIARLAPPALAQLQLVFARRGQADFVEISQGALRALGYDDDQPTDLLLALDYRIRHLLVDEFQDTSHSQFELLVKLTAGWEEGDGRTLFLVGDPMQSIYRFREAEVALFVRAWNHGIGSVRLEPVTLSANFRSQAGIVDWVNAAFARIMPPVDDVAQGAVRYAPSHPVHGDAGKAVHVHPFLDGEVAALGSRVAGIVQGAGDASVAILVRNRSHLREVVPRLREAGLAFRAIEIEPLGDRPVVQDLFALTRALSHLADRTAWLAVLRAPWCGLDLADLTALAGTQDDATVWSAMNDAGRLNALSIDGRARLEHTRAVLAPHLRDRRRGSLRAAVESAWLALGGPACVERDVDLGDADIYLDHLEGSEAGGALDDIASFEQSIEKLYALPDLEAPERLQVMTIHKAKGLEFDVVIVPGLDAGTGRDDRRLFMWMETPEDALLLAPVNAVGADDDPVYRYMREVDKKKADHELARLLYVAATRARRELHLLGCARLDDQGATKEPASGSLLRKLWPVVCDEFAGLAAPRNAGNLPSVPPASQGLLRRLDVAGLRYDVPAPARWSAPELPEIERLEFSWVGDTARRIGSVVHRRLQRIAEDEGRGWGRERIGRERPALKRELIARGVAASDLDRAIERAATALSMALEDERGRWLLGPQQGARNEYRITALVEGVRARLVIDRLFEDAEGRAWIVDYKTSSHEGSDPERFLDEEQLRYREQLERYAVAVAKPAARRGLYFPLLKGWREW
ncbi:MAG TPA: UvrD-helicase domain-containing protein [Usitatibacter sp.]|nr:UvrD-helicase domain-containing protein [Usitatibacter sp.]